MLRRYNGLVGSIWVARHVALSYEIADAETMSYAPVHGLLANLVIMVVSIASLKHQCPSESAVQT